jgi:hypothetical protein
MSWEAFRLTSKSPSELLHTLGPHGVDHLIRQALDTLWREYPDDSRTFENVRRRAQEVYTRNMKVWASIKKPSPQAFFENLLPYQADGFFRQAMVLCWMMMPRTGGRDVKQVRKIVSDMYQRNVDAWQRDNELFTGERAKPPKAPPKRRAGKRTSSSTKKPRRSTPRARKRRST